MKYLYLLLSLILSFSLSSIKSYAANDTIVRCKVQRASLSDNMILRIEHNATDTFDGAYDASKMFSQNTSQPQIWIAVPAIFTTQLAINSFPFYTAYKAFNIGFKTTVADSISFVAYDFARIDTNIRMYLQDFVANKIINLRKDTLYRFYSAAVNNANRFRIIFAGETTYAGDTLDYGFPDTLVALRVKEGHMSVSDTSINAYNVNIDPNTSLTVESNATLKVWNYLKIKSNENGTASFIPKGPTTFVNPSIVEKYLSDVTQGGWYLSSPVQSSDFNVFNGADGVWIYDANNGHWQLMNSGTLVPMNGYVTKFTGINKKLSFNGTLNDNMPVVNLVRTSDNGGNFGWNLIGNSYPSAIDYDLIPSPNKVNLNNAIYFRKLNGDVAAYVDNLEVNGGSSIIPSMQAFWMQVSLTKTNGSLTIPNSCRLHSINQQFKKTNNKNSDALKISISDGNNTDETAIKFKPEACSEFDAPFDANKMFSDKNSMPQIYTVTPSGDKLAINSLNFTGTAVDLPLGFYAANAVSMKLNLLGINNFENVYKVLLEDVYNNTLTILSDLNSYSFTSASGYYDDRFILHITPAINNITDNQNSDVNIYYTDNQLTVSGNGFESDVDFEVYNALGQKISHGTIPQNNPHYIKKIKIDSGIYFISLFSEGHHLITNRKLLMW